MSIVVLNLPSVKRKIEERPKTCPSCRGETFQRWGQVNKPVKDTQVRQVKVYRYCCCHCQKAFRHYPPGVMRSQQVEASTDCGGGRDLGQWQGDHGGS